MIDSTSDVPLKQCSKKQNCKHPDGPFLPATTEFFSERKRTKDGLRESCKACSNYESAEWRAKNQERIKVYRKKNYQDNAEYRRQYTREYYRQHQGERIEYARKYREDHPEEVAQYQREYNRLNAERKREYTRRYYRTNTEQCLNSGKRWYKNNRIKLLRRLSEDRRNNPEKYKARERRQIETGQKQVQYQKYKTRKRGLVDNFSFAEWQRALEYFNGRCAVCGRQLNDLFGEHTAAMDHWIPISSPDCPGTIPTNIVPLCHGVGGCNNSKHNKLPKEWLVEQFGKRKAKQILERIHTYFEWVKSNNEPA